MKLLIIQGSPDPESFSHKNASAYYQKAKSLGHEVDFIDLSKGDFDPVLKYGFRKHMENEDYPQKMQKLIQNAEHLVFFFPVWWSSEPAILKGWLDRVLTPKFAYKYTGDFSTEKLLLGKTADLFISSHAPKFIHKIYGGVVSRWKHFILGFCGIKLKKSFVLGKMETKNDTEEYRKLFIEKCSNTIPK